MAADVSADSLSSVAAPFLFHTNAKQNHEPDWRPGMGWDAEEENTVLIETLFL